jgi:hypothetical protein
MSKNNSPEDPVDHFLESVSDIMEKIVKSQTKAIQGSISKEIHERLALVEKQVELLKKVSEETVASVGLSPSEVNKMIENPDSLPERERKIIQRAQKLEKEVEEKQVELHQEMVKKLKGEKKEKSVRKKKFDRLGANKNWKPL